MISVPESQFIPSGLGKGRLLQDECPVGLDVDQSFVFLRAPRIAMIQKVGKLFAADCFLELIETGPLRNVPESCNEGGRRNEVAREGRGEGWGGFFGTKSEVGTAQKEDRKQPDRCTSATGCLEVENGCRHLAENFGFHGRDFRRKE